MIRLKKLKNILIYTIHNSIFLYFSYIFFPSKFVLGNAKLSFWAAVFVSGFVWTLILKRLLLTIQTRSRFVRFVLSWIFNFVALWIVARIAPYSGFGVVKFTWLIGLAFIANIVQQNFYEENVGK